VVGEADWKVSLEVTFKVASDWDSQTCVERKWVPGPWGETEIHRCGEEV